MSPQKLIDVDRIARQLLADTSAATAGARNEASLRHELEKALENCCGQLGLPWTPFRLDLVLRTSDPRRKRFADVAHGGVIIEYEPPRSLGGSAASLTHACSQAEEYCRLLANQEGRRVGDYVLIVWDGTHIAFGEMRNSGPAWSSLAGFSMESAKRLLTALNNSGTPLVHPLLLADLAGPESTLGNDIIPLLFRSVRNAAAADKTTKTKLLFFEWRRLFGQVVGVQTESLKELLRQQSRAHGASYASHPAAYLFSLNTFIAIVAKIAAALALPGVSEDLRNTGSSLRDRLRLLESGQLFTDAGVLNMLNGDFFAWYLDDEEWKQFEEGLETLLASLSNINFDISQKSPDSTRDLFKGLYESFVPRAVRHALGEFYTPDWLAAHVVTEAGWQLNQSLTDPACGTGTFVLEALRRRLKHATADATASELLAGLTGMDLNPMAVLAARASLVVFLARRLDRSNPIRLPVYLADAINPAEVTGSAFRHTLQTEKGIFSFVVPSELVAHRDFFGFFAQLRELVEANLSTRAITGLLTDEQALDRLSPIARSQFELTIDSLVRLHEEGWNGIWCSILAERFAAGAVPPADRVCGNPPWVKWSHLPPEYASFIKERCLELGVFSEDRWVGGIESDISTVITYVAAEKLLRDRGVLAFLITGTVFANESSQGFRRFEIERVGVSFGVIRVEDFGAVAPFEGVTNHPTLLILRRDQKTKYPITYRWWEPARTNGQPKRFYEGSEEFKTEARYFDDLAAPVPGTDAGPWLKGSRAQHEVWKRLFGSRTHPYVARKGITTDANGIFFVRLIDFDKTRNECRVENEPSIGKRDDVPKIKARVDCEHLFPLLRGRGVSCFAAEPDPNFYALVPQRGMHGNPELPRTSRATFRYLNRFRSVLETRSSFRRFQSRQPWWSLWSTGTYTFAPYKVAWREMAGGRFAAAIVKPVRDTILGRRVVIPDHKLYFVPCKSLTEAAYLTALLNAPIVSEAISAYAAQLSLGVSVVEYLALPVFDAKSPIHKELVNLALEFTGRVAGLSDTDWQALDSSTRQAFSID